MVRLLKIVPTVMVWHSRKLKHSIHLLKFPDELLDKVLEYLEKEELLQMNMVCRRFNHLAGKYLWHSIFVSTPINDVAIGTPWANYTNIPQDRFMELLKLKKHQTKFMKRLVLGHMSVDSFGWFRNLVSELKGCHIAISKVFELKLVKKLNLFNRSSLMGAGVWWNEFGHLDVAMIRNPYYDFTQFHLIKSLRIGSVDHDFLNNLVPRLILLESLSITLLERFRIQKKIRVTTLEIIYSRQYIDFSEIFEVLRLKSLNLEGHQVGWSDAFHGLVSVTSLRMDGTIRNLPNYSLRELHYLGEIHQGDFDHILRHPITYLTLDSLGRNRWLWRKVKKIKHKFKGMSSLKTLKIGKIKYRVVQSCWGNKYIRMTIVPDTITISIF